jgi:hypothetical protein
MSPATKPAPLAERGSRPFDIGGHQLDAGIGGDARRSGPSGRPVAGIEAIARRGQPRGQQALAAADVEQRAVADQAALEQCAEDRVAVELAPRETPGEAAGGTIRSARRIEQRRNRSPAHYSTERNVTGRKPARRTASSRRGSTSRITGLPAAVRAALPSWTRRMSPPRRLRSSRRSKPRPDRVRAYRSPVASSS